MNTKADVSGHLREVKGIYHAVINYYDADGKRHTTSKTTKLPVKGNKRKAESILYERIANFVIPIVNEVSTVAIDGKDMPIAEFVLEWIKMRFKLGQIRPNTYSSYCNSHISIERYFAGSGVTVGNITEACK